MLRRPIPIALALMACILLSSWWQQPTKQGDPFVLTDETALWEVLEELGKVKMNELKDLQKVMYSVQKGQELVEYGYTTDFNARKTAKISKNLVCISCHSPQAEHTIPATLEAKSRLEYADSMNLPFLPASPLHGMVNRIVFFCDDYQNVYDAGNDDKQLLLRKSHTDIRVAIQACNQINANGRSLDDWEIESILAYLWTLELNMGDLEIEAEDMQKIRGSLETDYSNARAVNILRRYYNEVYPSHLPAPLTVDERRLTSPVLNSFNDGRLIYERSCLHCHGANNYAKYDLDMKINTFKFLKKHFDDEKSKFSIYNAVRYNPEVKRSSCINYSAERMSDAQIQDLRFYVTQMANLGDYANDYYSGH